MEIGNKVQDLLEKAPTLTGEVEIFIYETESGLQLYLSDDVVNTVFGGILNAQDIVSNTTTLTVNGETVDITNRNSLRNGCIACFKLTNYDMSKPDTSSPIQRAWNDFKDEFHRNFIEENRWTYLAKGLGNTLLITLFALILGVVLLGGGSIFLAVSSYREWKRGKVAYDAYMAELRAEAEAKRAAEEAQALADAEEDAYYDALEEAEESEEE